MTEILKSLEKYNFWSVISIPTGFSRAMYLDRVGKFIGNDLLKVLIGQRRSGKSYLLRQIIQQLIASGTNPKNIFYLNKELADFNPVQTSNDLDALIKLYKKTYRIRGKVFVFLDEVQEIEGWEKSVNSLAQDYRDSYEVFITGSNSTMLSSELATYLSDRYVAFQVYPYSFSEYAQLRGLKKTKEILIEYMERGGLPELARLPDEETQRHYVESLFNTILLEDVVKRYAIKDVPLLESLFLFLAGNIGNLFSVNAIVNYLASKKVKTSVETLSVYLAYLEQAFLIHRIDRYDIRGKSVFASSRKYYLNDLAFRAHFTSSYATDVGKQLENIVCLHFKMHGYSVHVGSLYQKEIDFVVEKDGVRTYVQVAYLLADERVQKREFENLEKIKDSHEKIVLSLDDVTVKHPSGIKHLKLWEFLGKEL